VVVPVVTGSRAHPVFMADAIGQLQSAGFRVAIEDQDSRTGFPNLAVVGQDTDPGQVAPRGTIVTIAVVGDSHAPIVPDVIGMSVADARRALTAAGLQLTVHRTSKHKPLDTDRVVTEDVPSGIQVAPGTVVNVGAAPH
jgi:serine/threonine-protein kinase